ncbi:glycosyltransferase family 2 protein [Polynucleobacter sp. Tro8-14-1]|uniref:glycosyltransferase family 2 protein n=1 Tax=Polynucleobacter sp. Tro8-14-1 TaxID=1758383 RepID=UPI001C0BA8C8|nr:glycosyltransferase family 2 protein [Polynucleobacter sp. Tro8-14-1]MBU3563544.1 glycosyltransferase [Polynucleobacter sp. Tro8-14-1]
MPAFNAEKHIAAAIESILQQDFTNFELIILNDGSKDKTGQVIDQFKDPRIYRIELQENQGLVKSRNQLVAASRGRYIAFLDSDDIALPHRLQAQVNFLDLNQVDICGGAYYSLYEATGKKKASKERYSDADIRALMTISSPLCNPAVMGRAEVFKTHPYKIGKDYAEDYSLWIDLALAGCRFANLKERLITYRIHDRQTSQVQNSETNTIFKKSREYYLAGLGIGPSFAPRSLSFSNRMKIAIPFLMQLNHKIPNISVGANYEIYARFQFRGNGVLTPFTRLERLMVSTVVSLYGRLA